MTIGILRDSCAQLVPWRRYLRSFPKLSFQDRFAGSACVEGTHQNPEVEYAERCALDEACVSTSHDSVAISNGCSEAANTTLTSEHHFDHGTREPTIGVRQRTPASGSGSHREVVNLVETSKPGRPSCRGAGTKSDLSIRAAIEPVLVPLTHSGRGGHDVPAVMNRSLSLVSVVVVAALLATGCSGSASTPTAPSSLPGSPTSPVDQPPRSGSPAPTVDQLAGTWNLQSLQPAGDVDQTTPAGASYTLTFADGRLSTRADCNVCGGPFVLSGQTLTAGPTLACTRAACPTMAFESTYTRLLGGDSTVTLADGALVLSSVRGVLHFAR